MALASVPPPSGSSTSTGTTSSQISKTSSSMSSNSTITSATEEDERDNIDNRDHRDGAAEVVGLRKRGFPPNSNPSQTSSTKVNGTTSNEVGSKTTQEQKQKEKAPATGLGIGGLTLGQERLGRRMSEAKQLIREKMKTPLISPIIEKMGADMGALRENFSKGVEVKFAPLNVPPRRRLQTAAVALWALLLPICLFCFLICLSFPPLWPILIPYIIWIQFDRAPDRGGRPSPWMRKAFIWRYFAEYYPCSIVKEAELPPDRPYLFGYHPHGIIGMGAFATFATDGTNFSQQFPGISPHLLTLESNFGIPLYRDILMSLGVCSVSKKSCANILAKGPGYAITIVVGGAAESLSAHPGTADLTLKKRFGFIKMAVREGADLVPVFSFGENDIYDQLANHKGSLVYKLQKKFQKMFGFTLPLFYGRGIFNYNYGLMPFRHPIVSVVGTPIHIERNPNPSDELIQEIQSKYIAELMHIWEKYKDVYARNRTKELTLVD